MKQPPNFQPHLFGKYVITTNASQAKQRKRGNLKIKKETEDEALQELLSESKRTWTEPGFGGIRNDYGVTKIDIPPKLVDVVRYEIYRHA